MQESEINWDTLARLRSQFLAAGTTAAPYWQGEEDLSHYHATFAARIGWKWDHALQATAHAGFQLQSKRILDWGCGSGIAALRVLDFYGPQAFEEVQLWDHSLTACHFAKRTLQEAYPDLEVQIVPAPSHAAPIAADTLVLVSHAVTELGQDARETLAATLRTAAQILFVEPGDHSASRKLVSLREALISYFHPLAPCTHCHSCPLLAHENQRHWCHFFAKPPVEAFTESFWTHFAQTMEIDLRSLPYSFLALQNKAFPKRHSSPVAPHNSAASRLLGRPRQFKGYTRLLSCDSEGLRDLELQKRDDKTLWKKLTKGPTHTLFQWGEIDPATARLKSGKQI